MLAQIVLGADHTSVDLADIRRTAISALFSDPVLYQHLVLKGGNALELVHGVISRGSIDIDLSISGQFDDVEDIQQRIHQALRRAFQAHNLIVFDFSFKTVPPVIGTDLLPWWGGYIVEFKIIDSVSHERLREDFSALQRQSIPIDSRQGRRFHIDISKHEYCRDKVRATVAGQVIFVYSEEMCVFEKYRSICQQMPDYQYALDKSGHPRARDFYDIYTTITSRGIDVGLPENLLLCRAIFEAKHVPLRLISEIDRAREFHRPDWDAVRQAVTSEVFDYDFYFEFVVDEARKLKSLWVE